MECNKTNKGSSAAKNTQNFINGLLTEGNLSQEYFEIIYSKSIQPEIYSTLINNIQNINNILGLSINNGGLLEIQNYQNTFGFLFEDNLQVFYCIDSHKFQEIGNDTNEYYKNYINSFEIPLELISFSSYKNISISNEKEINPQPIQNEIQNAIKGAKGYLIGKKFEFISLERFNYTSNLEENYIDLIHLPNIIYYLLPFEQMEKVKNLLDNLEISKLNNEEKIKTMKDNLKYSPSHYGYNELDGIFKNEINLNKKINNINSIYKFKKIYTVINGEINESITEEDFIKPYSINYIEVKKNLKLLKSNNQIYQFLNKCKIFIKVFEKLKINILEKPSIYDDNENFLEFPKKLVNDFFFIVNNDKEHINLYINEIKNQINNFIKDNNNPSFSIHFYYSNGFFDSDEIKYIHNSKIINNIAISHNLNKNFHNLESKIKEQENKIKEQEKKIKGQEKKIKGQEKKIKGQERNIKIIFVIIIIYAIYNYIIPSWKKINVYYNQDL